MWMVEPMRELEFPSQSSGLVLPTVVAVENLQRHRTIRAGGPVRPVHGGISTLSQGCVDDVTLEFFAGRKHISRLGRAARSPFSPLEYLSSASRR